MPRIRSIKPEFPHSQSMGNVSRDARLCFIELWTLADDAGIVRGNSRLLASLLFPYDEDVLGDVGLLEFWLAELEREGCLVRYRIEGAEYTFLCNWLKHQKIDKPTASKMPPYCESSRILANPREVSSEDRDLDLDLDQGSGSGSGSGSGPTSVPNENSGPPGDSRLLPGEKIDFSKPHREVDETTPEWRVFDHWRTTHGHPRAKLDPKRMKLLRAQLKLYDEATLCQSITGYLHSPHHMGTDPKGSGTKYDDIELMLRDAKHIDQGLRFHQQGPPGPVLSATSKTTQMAMQSFLSRGNGR